MIVKIFDKEINNIHKMIQKCPITLALLDELKKEFQNDDTYIFEYNSFYKMIICRKMIADMSCTICNIIIDDSYIIIDIPARLESTGVYHKHIEYKYHLTSPNCIEMLCSEIRKSEKNLTVRLFYR